MLISYRLKCNRLCFELDFLLDQKFGSYCASRQGVKNVGEWANGRGSLEGKGSLDAVKMAYKSEFYGHEIKQFIVSNRPFGKPSYQFIISYYVSTCVIVRTISSRLCIYSMRFVWLIEEQILGYLNCLAPALISQHFLM